MQLWISKGPPLRHGAQQEYDPDTGTYLNVTPQYIEAFIPIQNCFETDPSRAKAFPYIVTYWLPVSDTQWFVATSWDDAFDFITIFMKGDAVPGIWRAMRESWPTTAMLLSNWLNDDLNRPCLRKMVDPDRGAEIWILTVPFGNIELTDLLQLFQGYALEAVYGLLESTNKVGHEYDSGPPANMIEYSGESMQRANLERTVKACGRFLRDSLAAITGTTLS